MISGVSSTATVVIMAQPIKMPLHITVGEDLDGSDLLEKEESILNRIRVSCRYVSSEKVHPGAHPWQVTNKRICIHNNLMHV
jgi:hypothetical protein